jgi:hypothetical protein
MNRSRKMGRARRCVNHAWENYIKKIRYENPKERPRFRKQFVNARAILKRISRKQVVRLQTKFIWLKLKSSDIGSCEDDNERLGFIIGRKFHA